MVECQQLSLVLPQMPGCAATKDEMADWEALQEVMSSLLRKFSPDGFKSMTASPRAKLFCICTSTLFLGTILHEVCVSYIYWKLQLPYCNL